MRPRLLHRGNAGLFRHPLAGLEIASMRPRLLHRGNRSTSWGTSATSMCFNEAAATSPRKPIFGFLALTYCQASMRPRLLHRGNGRVSVGECRGYRCFNEAAATSPRKQIDFTATGPYGPGLQ